MPLKTYHLYSLKMGDNMHGKFTGKFPSQVARKIFKKLSKLSPVLEFTVIDRMTQKEFTYKGEKIRNATPVVKTFANGKSIVSNFTYHIERKKIDGVYI